MEASKSYRVFVSPTERFTVMTIQIHDDEIRILAPSDVTIGNIEKRLLKKKAAKKHGVEYVDLRDDQIQVVRHNGEQFLRVRLDKSGWKDSQIIIVESDEFEDEEGNFDSTAVEDYEDLAKFLSKRFEIDVEDLYDR